MFERFYWVIGLGQFASHDVKLLGGSILVLICDESFESQIVDKLPIP